MNAFKTPVRPQKCLNFIHFLKQQKGITNKQNNTWKQTKGNPMVTALSICKISKHEIFIKINKFL